jgi:hypothetical protein
MASVDATDRERRAPAAARKRQRGFPDAIPDPRRPLSRFKRIEFAVGKGG